MPAKRKRSSKAQTIEGELVDEGREAPANAIILRKDIVLPVMNEAQTNIILGKTPKYAIRRREGKGGQQFKYVTHGYVTGQLNKAFGFDWDLVLKPMQNGQMYALEAEQVVDKDGKFVKQNRYVAVCGDLVVRIHNPKDPTIIIATITKSGFGSQQWLPSMEFGDALKGARSDLIKTCAFQLGIALDLYWDDQTELASYNEREKRDREAEQLAEQLNGAPRNAVLLISRAASDYGMDIKAIAKLLKVKESELFNLTEEQVAKAWSAITKQHPTNTKE